MRSNCSTKAIITNHFVPSTTYQEKSTLLISHMMIPCLPFLGQMAMSDSLDSVKSHDLYSIIGYFFIIKLFKSFFI